MPRRSTGRRCLCGEFVAIALVSIAPAFGQTPSTVATWNELQSELHDLAARQSYADLDTLAPVETLLERVIHTAPALQTWPNEVTETFVRASAQLVTTQIYESADPRWIERGLTRGLAAIAVARVDPARSMEYARAAQALLLAAGERSLNEGRYEHARAFCRRALQLLEDSNDAFYLPQLRASSAEAARMLGHFDEAETHLDLLSAYLDDHAADIAADIAEAPALDAWLPDSRDVLRQAYVVLYADMGLADQANRWLLRGRGATAPSNPDREFVELDLSAIASLAGERCRRVVRNLSDDVLRRASPTARGLLLARRGVALAELALHDAEFMDAAHADLREAARLAPSDGLRRLTAITLLDLAALRGDWDEVRRGLASLGQTVDGRLPHVDERALLAVHAMRLARATGASAAEREVALRGLRDANDAALAAWGSSRIRPGGVGFLNYSGRRSALGELVGELVARAENAPLDAEVLEPVFRAEAVGTLARALHATPATLASIRTEVLRPGVGWIAFVPAWQTTHVFAVDHDEIVHAEIPWRYLSEPLRDDFGNEVAMVLPRTDAAAVAAQVECVRNAAQRWTALLLPDVIRDKLRQWNGCYVTGLELLGHPPFNALLLDDRPLGVARAIARIPSMTVALAIARRARLGSGPGTASLRVIAAPTLDPTTAELAGPLSPLTLTPDTFRHWIGPFAASDVDAYVGPNATLRVLRDGAARPPRILHVLAHAMERLDREDFSTLVLAGERDAPGFVSPADGDSWLRADIVILSSCAAARGRVRIGDDGAGQFVGASFRAGARCVIAADQRIELDATLEFGRLVHEGLAAGRCPAEAVRAARETMWSSSDFALPSCWALLAVHGLAFDP